MDYEILWNEIDGDPLGRGYSGMADAAIAIDLDTAYRNLERTSITKAELWENTNLTEYAALTAAARQAYGVLIDMDSIDVTAGTNSRAALAALFPAGSTTRANLLALAIETVATSRAAELGLSEVTAQDVMTAKERYG